MQPLDRSPLYVGGFLLVLALPQVAAIGKQVANGFRPFGHAPGRVPLSWDMFSTAITRCDVRWDPPLTVDGQRIAALHDIGLRLEWDPVFDRIEDYVWAAKYGCSHAERPTTTTLTCFTFEGKRVDDAFRCR